MRISRARRRRVVNVIAPEMRKSDLTSTTPSRKTHKPVAVVVVDEVVDVGVATVNVVIEVISVVAVVAEEPLEESIEESTEESVEASSVVAEAVEGVARVVLAAALLSTTRPPFPA